MLLLLKLNRKLVITLNRRFSQHVKFMGHVLTNKGLEPDREYVEAIKAMPKPQNLEDVQCLKGFMTYLAKFLPKLVDVMEQI